MHITHTRFDVIGAGRFRRAVGIRRVLLVITVQ